MTDTSTGPLGPAGPQISGNIGPNEANPSSTAVIGKLPITEGWAIAIGCIGLIGIAGTRFGPIAAGLGGVAVIYQLSAWLTATMAPASTTTPAQVAVSP